MSLLSHLLTHAVAWCIQSLQWLVVLVGKTLLGVQRVLSWLDGAHPLATLSRPLTRLVQQHPKRIVSVLASLLMAAGGGAFAVANLGPDAAQLPVVNLTEPVTVSGLDAQAQALDLRDLRLLRSDTTRSADTPRACCADWACLTLKPHASCARTPKHAMPSRALVARSRPRPTNPSS